jgi:hypothetical protein
VTLVVQLRLRGLLFVAALLFIHHLETTTSRHRVVSGRLTAHSCDSCAFSSLSGVPSTFPPLQLPPHLS